MVKMLVDGVLVEDEEAGAFETSSDEKKPPEKKAAEPDLKKEAEDKAADEKKKADDDKAAADKKAEDDKKAAEDAPVTLTKRQFDSLMADIEDSKSLKKSVQSLSGTVGIQRQEIDNLKRTVPIEITEADFADMAKEFPEITKGLKTGLGGVLKRLVGFTPPKGAGDEEVKKAIFAAVNARETEVLEDEFPDWLDTVGKKDTDTKFRQWLVKQSPQYQKKVNETYSGAVIARALRRFNSDELTETKKAVEDKIAADKVAAEKKSANGRTAALKAAVQPRGDGGGIPPGAKEETEDEGLEKGYKEGR